MKKEDKKIKQPDPFDIKMDYSLFASIKYNRAIKECANEYDKKDFETFKSLFKKFLKELHQNNNMDAFSDLSAIMSMWGYHRKYCGMCGRPVIGKIYRLQGGKIVCGTCNASYKITDMLLEKENNQEEVTTEEEDIEKLSNLNEDDNETSK